MDTAQADQLLKELATLQRDELKERLLNFRGNFQFDLSEEFIDTLSDERLRHILWAAYLYACDQQCQLAGRGT